MSTEKVCLSQEDKERFSSEIKTASPVDFLIVADFLQEHKERFTAADWKFMSSHMGRRAVRLLKNAAYYQSWDGLED